MKVSRKNHDFPASFPFWARLKINKNRTTLVIDEKNVINKKTKQEVPGFVHREAIHVDDEKRARKKGYEMIEPNPDINDNKPMYLKKPAELPQTLFKIHNRHLNMPIHLEERYKKERK